MVPVSKVTFSCPINKDQRTKCTFSATLQRLETVSRSLENVAKFGGDIIRLSLYTQGRINHSGAQYQRKAGALFSPSTHRHSQDFLTGVHFSSPKKLLVIVTFRHTRNTSKQRGKNLAHDHPPGVGGLSHGTTGTMVNPAVYIIHTRLKYDADISLRFKTRATQIWESLHER